MATKPDDWKRVKALFDAALDEEPARRLSFLQERCSDADVRAEVERLLAEHQKAGKFLSVPAIGEPTLDEILAPPKRKIDSYYLLELIGEGGMGEVWLAEQKEPVRRRVAIKLIKAGMDTREVVARFESERQALALMDHAAIAKVFEAGFTPEGRPYFVMEYVPGIPITAYCDKHKLTVRQRIELFIHVCEGVQHAHQKAIIHRDLKPSNILVSEVDGKPMPRIIDFGLAKATSQRLTDASIYTRVGAVLGTLDYMSPEQADSGGEDIDTRADVYSLGVVLYQLLVGALPLDLKKLAHDEMLRRLREQDVPRPSSRILIKSGDSAVTARNRGTDPPSLIRLLRGDPDAVVLRALEKDRKRRYGSPSELAADLGRYLCNEPVSAHAPSAAYRGRKYIRRHRLAVAIATAAVLLLATSVITEGVLLRSRTREKNRADQNLALAEKAVDESLSSPSAQQSQEAPESPETENLRRQLQQKAQTFYEAFLKSSDSENAVMNMAMAHLRLGDIDRLRLMNQDAVNEYTSAIAQFSKLSAEHPANPAYRQQMGYCHNWIGETLRLWLKSGQKPAQYTVASAQEEYNQAIAIQQALHQNAPDNRDYQQDLARGFYNRGILQWEQTQADPEPDYQRAVELLEPLVGAGRTTPEEAATSLQVEPEPLPEQELARVDNNIGLDLDRKKQFEQAVLSIKQATQIADELLLKDQANYEYKAEAEKYYNNLARELGQVYSSEQPKNASDLDKAKNANLRAQELAGDLAKTSPDLADELDHIAQIRGWLDKLGREYARH
jgi:serine/threonine protein kinase